MLTEILGELSSLHSLYIQLCAHYTINDKLAVFVGHNSLTCTTCPLLTNVDTSDSPHPWFGLVEAVTQQTVAFSETIRKYIAHCRLSKPDNTIGSEDAKSVPISVILGASLDMFQHILHNALAAADANLSAFYFLWQLESIATISLLLQSAEITTPGLSTSVASRLISFLSRGVALDASQLFAHPRFAITSNCLSSLQSRNVVSIQEKSWGPGDYAVDGFVSSAALAGLLRMCARACKSARGYAHHFNLIPTFRFSIRGFLPVYYRIVYFLKM
jgi:hypothetical protein